MYVWMCVRPCKAEKVRKWENVCVRALVLYACVRACSGRRVRVFLTSLLRHSSRESGVKRKSGSHSVGIHGSGPRGPVRAPVFTDKASPAGPRHTQTERGATEGEERRRGGDKVTRGEKLEKGAGRGRWEKVSVAAPIHPRLQVWWAVI